MSDEKIKFKVEARASQGAINNKGLANYSSLPDN